jgi:hypothetical protein
MKMPIRQMPVIMLRQPAAISSDGSVKHLAEQHLKLSWHFRKNCLTSGSASEWSYWQDDVLPKMLNRLHGLQLMY